ncbi:hypothetical protein ACGFJT_36815 [Actinomadura geliboluensis]|uniref:hypothetical protein n=1 Tax=Actinomadura geliboluensis TaxID=882440 RepID=UPI0037190289
MLEIEKVNDGRGVAIWFPGRICVTVNGCIWLLNVELNKFFGFTVWEKSYGGDHAAPKKS